MKSSKLDAILAKGKQLGAAAKEQGQQTLAKGQAKLQQSLNGHLAIAVTGLSGAGKTTFITALVHQLLNFDKAILPLFEAALDGRILAVKRSPQADPCIASFNYSSAIESLMAASPKWPQATAGTSQLRLQIDYQPNSRLRIFSSQSLMLDICDYPGEWLLDLAMLDQDFDTWCDYIDSNLKQLEQARFNRKPDAIGHLINSFYDARAALVEGTDEAVLRVAKIYQQLLMALKSQGLCYLQPGRALVPHQLLDSPVISFFPVSPDADQSIKLMLSDRFEQYKQTVILPFYRDYFERFDRQLILVDCLTPLAAGKMQFNQQLQALTGIFQHFQYGKQSWLSRWFSSQYEQLNLVATKADHIDAEQRDKLVLLLEKMLYSQIEQSKLTGAKVELQAIASVRASTDGTANYQGKSYPSLTAKTLNAEQKHFNPGQLPDGLPDDDYWQSPSFKMYPLAPAKSEQTCLGHIGLDALLQSLIGDKL
ncbi:YcjX family protein [Paraferrimonas sp. SM1919]|uniref:YcjX family protein n=1 Tax=Paraferrimonas sp. SM1919 TaxID=2662263 RepID=UPI0013D31C89|nr:YcjX family protein [Paraferrimonas sp. SM1919]